MYGDHMTGWGWTLIVFWSLFWVGLLGVAIWAAAHWARGNSQAEAPEQPPTKSAHELLDERLARGDIDPDDYQQRRDLIDQRTPTGV